MYILAKNGRDWASLDEETVRTMITKAEIFAETYLFRPEIGLWQRVEEIAEFAKDPKIILHSSPTPIPRPDFIPEEKAPIQSLSDNNIFELFEKQSIQLRKDLKFILDEYLSVGGLGVRQRIEQPEVDHEVDKRDLESEIELYRLENARLLHQVNDLKKRDKENLSETQDLANLHHELRLANEEIEKANKEIEALNQKILRFKIVISKEREKQRESSRRHSPQVEMQKIRDFQESRDEIEKRLLFGHNFEVSNDPVWLYDNGEGVKGPLHFDEMLDLKDEKVIGQRTMIKKRGMGYWIPFQEVHELNAKVVPFMREEKGKQCKYYLIERKDFRAPFYDVVTLRLGDRPPLKGYCTSLSIGGCFIELTDMPSDLQEGQIGLVSFDDRVLKQKLNLTISIRVIKHDRPIGIGASFTDIGLNEKEIILDYISNFLKGAEKKAS